MLFLLLQTGFCEKKVGSDSGLNIQIQDLLKFNPFLAVFMDQNNKIALITKYFF